MKMSQVHADVERFVQPLPLDEYRQRVGSRLDNISAGADMAVRNVLMLDRRPAFDTHARSDLDALEGVLQRALEKCQAAKAAYDQKPQEAF